MIFSEVSGMKGFKSRAIYLSLWGSGAHLIESPDVFNIRFLSDMEAVEDVEKSMVTG